MNELIKNAKIEHIIALLSIFFIFAILFYVVLSFKDKPEIIFGVVGSLTGSLTMIFGFFYGSSRGSQKKDEAIQKSIDNQSKTETT